MRLASIALGLLSLCAVAGAASAAQPSEAPSPAIVTAKVALLGGGGAVDVRLVDRLYVGAELYRYWSPASDWWTAANVRASYRLTYGHLFAAGFVGIGYLRPRTFDTTEGYQIVESTSVSPTAGVHLGLQFGRFLVGFEGQFTSYEHTDVAHGTSEPRYTRREYPLFPWFFVGGQL